MYVRLPNGLLEGCHRRRQKPEMTFFLGLADLLAERRANIIHHNSCMTVPGSSIGKSTRARHCKGDLYDSDVIGRVTRVDSKRAYGGRCSL